MLRGDIVMLTRVRPADIEQAEVSAAVAHGVCAGGRRLVSAGKDVAGGVGVLPRRREPALLQLPHRVELICNAPATSAPAASAPRVIMERRPN